MRTRTTKTNTGYIRVWSFNDGIVYYRAVSGDWGRAGGIMTMRETQKLRDDLTVALDEAKRGK
jgi:hypothetical protein